ncbi:putative MFS family arabinose efflux permease [Kushneria sinocarnis]|uniref:Putative MFS family arabinose efflux permease n=1 Tax=Kushneria sinocarnis TaxID=595502 RepID=A0A420WTQ8_9GAMM|nr:MFS transporter [Kushneria sinocarnis]RKQ95925.1 putative MFS family arabinose efflux permease [Kushneria sinocarnis]
MKRSSLLLNIESRAITGLALLYGVRMLGLFMVLPILALYSSHLEYATPALVGVALGGYGLTQAILQIPFGMLSDRTGRKPVIALGLLLFIVGSVVAALATSIYGVIIGRCIQGSGAVAGAIMALLADRTREEVRTTAMATIGMSIGIAFALAMVIGPLIAHAAGLAGVFWSTALLAALGLLVLWRVVPGAARQRHRDVGLDRSQFFSMLRRPDLLRLDFSILSLHAILTGCFVAVPVRLAALGIPASEHGWVYLPVMATAFVGMIPLIIAAEKYRHMKLVFTGTVASLVIILTLMSLLPPQSWWLIALLWLFFVAFNLLEASLPSLISKAAPAGTKGTAMGIYSTSQFLGTSLGGAAGGAVAGTLGVSAVFGAAAVLALIWTLIIWRMPAPRYLATELVSLERMPVGQEAALTARLQAIAGVEDALVASDEGVAYLKVDRARLDRQALDGLTGRASSTGSA